MCSRRKCFQSRFVLVGAAAVVAVDGGAWGQCPANELAKLTASDAEWHDVLGQSVSISGDVVVTGVSNDDDNGPDSGSAYVFRYDGSAWVQEQKLLASDGAALDRFGSSVALSDDWAVIGANYDDDNGPDSGSAYMFRFDGSSWVEELKLLAPDESSGGSFGGHVSISGDVVLIVDPGADTAYAYRFNGTTWIEEARITASDGKYGIPFATVAVSGDVALIGAPYDDGKKGSAYIFRFDGANWIEEERLTGDGSAALFGEQVSISGDVAVVATPFVGADTGAAYVYRFDGTNWGQEATLTPSDSVANHWFGHRVAVSGDVIVITARQDDHAGPLSGAAYVYRFDPDTSGWIEEAKLTASDAEAGHGFGSGVAISGDRAVIGALYDDYPVEWSGAAYVFGGLSDCDNNGTLDLCDIADGMGQDMNGNGILDVCECPWDLDGSGVVDVSDFLVLLVQWGPCPAVCNADIDGDGEVGILDFLLLLANWGPCP